MFRLATIQADKSTCLHKLGAVITKGGRVLSTGYNEIRYAKYTGHGTVHAEEMAIMRLLRNNGMGALSGATIYVMRHLRSGGTGLARPCSRCMGLIQSVGIKRIHYTTNEGTTETIKC